MFPNSLKDALKLFYSVISEAILDLKSYDSNIFKYLVYWLVLQSSATFFTIMVSLLVKQNLFTVPLWRPRRLLSFLLL